jgi:RNA polymerase sigma-70 factor (ECF subfamily)
LFGQFREPAMQSLHVNGTDMAYLEVGDGPPLVCVHGSLGDFRIWSAVLGPPSKKHRGQAEIRGAAAVAETFKSRAQAAKPALIDGAVGIAVIMRGRLRIALNLTIAGDRIVGIEAVADPERLGRFDLTVLNP